MKVRCSDGSELTGDGASAILAQLQASMRFGSHKDAHAYREALASRVWIYCGQLIDSRTPDACLADLVAAELMTIIEL